MRKSILLSINEIEKLQIQLLFFLLFPSLTSSCIKDRCVFPVALPMFLHLNVPPLRPAA